MSSARRFRMVFSFALHLLHDSPATVHPAQRTFSANLVPAWPLEHRFVTFHADRTRVVVDFRWEYGCGV